ncbi:MAG: ATP-dependent metallopeptidase FtsH/Yme1/Tma family protein, partial [Pseudomonadota bacterium]
MPKKKSQQRPKPSIFDLFNINKKSYGKKGAPKKTHFSVLYFIIAFLIMLAINNYFFSEEVKRIPYSEFKKLVGEGMVGNLTLAPELV